MMRMRTRRATRMIKCCQVGDLHQTRNPVIRVEEGRDHAVLRLLSSVELSAFLGGRVTGGAKRGGRTTIYGTHRCGFSWRRSMKRNIWQSTN